MDAWFKKYGGKERYGRAIQWLIEDVTNYRLDRDREIERLESAAKYLQSVIDLKPHDETKRRITLTSWRGKPVEDMTKDELVEALKLASATTLRKARVYPPYASSPETFAAQGKAIDALEIDALKAAEADPPVVLIGLDKSNGRLVAVGLYRDADAAKADVMSGDVPFGCHYIVMTPKLNSWLRAIAETKRVPEE